MNLENEHRYCEETGKRCYKSKAEVKRMLRFIRKRRSTDGLREYVCNFCKFYHLTSAENLSKKIGLFNRRYRDRKACKYGEFC